MPTAPAQNAAGRFKSEWRDDELVELLGVVARHARPLRPTTVTMRAWDAARTCGLPEGKAVPPQAHGIFMRLNSRARRALSWEEWLQVATGDPATLSHRLIAHTRADFEVTVQDVHVRYACRRVAEHLGVDGLTPDRYDDGRARLIAADRRRRTGVPESIAELLPTANQLQHGRDWAKAMRIASLKREQRSPAHQTLPSGGLPQVDAQVVFAHINKRLAPRPELMRFMRDCGAALKAWPTGTPYRACYDEAEAKLRADGYTGELPRPARGNRAPAPYKLPQGATIPGAPPAVTNREAYERDPETKEKRKAELYARCIAGTRAFDAWMREHRPGVRVTQKRYGAWRVGTDWPAPSRFQQFGGWTKLLKRARRARL